MNTVGTNQTAIIPAKDLPPLLFSEFVEYIDREPQTARTYITNLKQFAAWMQYSDICRPIRADILKYKDFLTSEHDAIRYDITTGWKYRTDGNGDRIRMTCKPNTVKQYLQSVRQFFKWTDASGLYPNIAENIHPPKVKQGIHRKDALTAADVRNIEESIRAAAERKARAAKESPKDTAGRFQRATEQGKRDYAMYVLAVNAGLRCVELSRARVRDLETRNGDAVLYVWGKGCAEPDARKPIAPEVYEVLRDYLKSRRDRPTANSPLFVSTGNRSGGRAIAPTTISKILKRSMQNAGYDSERITAHSLRHTAGTAVQEITGNLYTTQKYMRHSSPATTEIYLHNDTERTDAEAARKLYSYYHSY